MCVVLRERSASAARAHRASASARQHAAASRARQKPEFSHKHKRPSATRDRQLGHAAPAAAAVAAQRFSTQATRIKHHDMLTRAWAVFLFGHLNAYG